MIIDIVKEYQGKHVTIVSDGMEWRGLAESFTWSYDEVDGIDKLYLIEDGTGDCIEFAIPGIDSIKEID